MSIKFSLSVNWIYHTDEEYLLLKYFENNQKCVPFGLLIINIIFFNYYWPFLYLFWISSPLSDIKYQLCYLKFYLFIVTSFFVLFLCLLTIVYYYLWGIHKFVVFLCIVHVWFCVLYMYGSVYCTCMVLCIVHVWFCVLYMYGSVYCTCMVLCIVHVWFCVLFMYGSVYCTCMVLCIVHVWFCVLYMYGSVYCTCMVLCIVHVWFWLFILLSRFLLLVVKGQLFQVQKCSIEIFLS
jgi:hypothetical protein